MFFLGEFATGTIVRRYTSGSWIPVIVDITTNHGGYFSFKLCPNNDISKDPSQRCFDEYVLEVRKRLKENNLIPILQQTGKNGATEQMLSTDLMGPTTLYVKLPENVTCHQCIIQVCAICVISMKMCHMSSLYNRGTCHDKNGRMMYHIGMSHIVSVYDIDITR